FDGGGDLVEMRQCPLPRALVHYSTFTVRSSCCLSMRQLAAEQTLSESVPATFLSPALPGTNGTRRMTLCSSMVPSSLPITAFGYLRPAGGGSSSLNR